MRKSAYFLLLIYLIVSCGGSPRSKVTTAVAGQSEVEMPPVPELPLPSVPETLRTPEDRAAYIIRHFWDAMDFSDTTLSRNQGFIEQNFANYISLYPILERGSDVLSDATKKLVSASEADDAAFHLLAETAEKYLFDPNSPMLDEESYIFFLEAFLDSGKTDEFSRSRYSRQLSAVLKNRPGMTAADFSYITREGGASTLLKTGIEGDYLLLMFYDPDCEHCKETLAAMAQEPMFTEPESNGGIKVLAVYADGNLDLWNSTAKSLPAAWTVAFDTGDIYGNDLYVFRAMPSLYLLDRNKRIILKDASLYRLYGYFSGE